MSRLLCFIVVLVSTYSPLPVTCKLSLQIVKTVEDTITTVADNVEEKAGTDFSLTCELTSTSNDTDLFDENLSWIKGEKNRQNHSRFIPESSKHKTGINKSERRFAPLRIEDRGTYFCVSLKFDLFKSLELRVRNDVRRLDIQPLFETSMCSEQMFQCQSTGNCIIKHYTCDGVADCRDGSDESFETCQGEPCRDKIACDEGRCIPTSWCCDWQHDLNCTVTNRPACCQLLSDSYEEFGYPTVMKTQHNGARYLFILVCILSILFSIVLLLLILSKVVIFAKKTSLQQQRHNYCENIALRAQNDLFIDCSDGYYRVPSVPNRLLESSDANAPLLFPPRFNADLNDQPPSYVDVLRTNSAQQSDPPPPYTSREILNC